jgi:RNA polymerase sigma factor (sigma-70 family)
MSPIVNLFCRILPVGADILLKMTSDLDLLGQFAREKSQDAFTTLVNRHVNLVYSAALRQVRSPQLAQEIAQSVFADLARNAGKLSGAGLQSARSVTPWLYAVTRRTAIDAIRKESRRQLREQIAVEMNDMNATSAEWTQIEPLLDDAMAALDETDRSAILLRYFENKNLREVGEALGTSDDAAQKRVSRAMERLREFFSKRNVTIGASGLAFLISTNAIQAAPIGLALTISTAAVLTGTVVSTSTAIAVTKTIAMTSFQKILVSAALVATVGAGIFEAHQAAQLRAQNQILWQQQASSAEQFRQLQADNKNLSNRLAEIGEAKKLSDGQFNELLKLRGETTRLRALQMNSNVGNTDPFTQSVLALASRAAELNQHLQQMPDKKIPELQLLNESDWLAAAQAAQFDTDASVRKSLQRLRSIAKDKLPIGSALAAFASANNNKLPNDLNQLKPYFDKSRLGDLGLDDATFSAIIARYTLLHTGSVNDFPSGTWFVVENTPVDKDYDSRAKFGLGTSSVITTGIGETGDPDDSSY